MTSSSPTGDPADDQRWEQPRFEEPPVYSGPVLQPGQRRPAPPAPSQTEIWVGAAAGLVWPVMIILGVFTGVNLGVAIVIALVSSIVLNHVKRTLRAQRLAELRPPETPPPLR